MVLDQAGKAAWAAATAVATSSAWQSPPSQSDSPVSGEVSDRVPPALWKAPPAKYEVSLVSMASAAASSGTDMLEGRWGEVEAVRGPEQHFG